MDTKPLVLLLLVYFGAVQGYITGAPRQACESMLPGHGADPQTVTSPYMVSTSSMTFRCKQDITVTLNGSEPFKGFLCQVRTPGATYRTEGTLTSADGLQTTNHCGQDVAAITHTDNNNKTSAVFTWRTNVNVTSVYVVCTVVKEYSTLWTQQRSVVMTYEAGGDCSPDVVDPSGSGIIQPSLPVLFVGFVAMIGSTVFNKR